MLWVASCRSERGTAMGAREEGKGSCLATTVALVTVVGGLVAILVAFGDDFLLKVRAMFGDYPPPVLADLRPDPAAVAGTAPPPFLARLRNPSHEEAIVGEIRFEIDPARIGGPGTVPWSLDKYTAQVDPLSILPAATIEEDVAPPCRYGAWRRPLAYPIRIAPRATGLVRLDITPQRIAGTEACFVRVVFQSDHGPSNPRGWVFRFDAATGSPAPHQP